ncbi:MAG: hypothetical protein Q8N13_03860 [Acidovorax sp.]|nr:hypothetical protein [Acidovorax sp.]
MTLITTHIKWIMLVSGALTSTMFYAVLAPQAALMSTFGASISGPLAEIVVRNWGALITLVGAMLIYGAFRPIHRTLVIAVATISKMVFIVLVLTIGSQYLGKAGVAIVFDAVVVVLFVAYLASVRRVA